MPEKCPCCSEKAYSDCCKPLHDGAYPENALCLMRSRFSAYALNLPEYIIRTTHPESRLYNKNLVQWTQEILHFCRTSKFQKLEIIEFVDGPKIAYVSFIAYLHQNKKPLQLKEKSQFIKIGPRWLYVDGVFN